MNAAERSLAALFIAAALTACGAGEQPSREPPPGEDTAFGDMVQTMDKARAVEDTTRQHKEELDRALDAAEGNQ